MREANRKYLLLLGIFVFSFVFRMLLIFWDGYPSGADIGLHNSVIYSITGSGNADFFYNFYHIGGGTALTFPGYHIFIFGVIALTGLPEILAHGLVVSLFSSLIVLCGFLITQRVWSTSAAFIVAFLAAISRFDIEMLLWAGYPNAIALMLIPLTFYLYLERARFTKLPYLASTSILIGALFLTHSLSLGIFVSIIVVAMLGILVFPKKLGTTRKTALYWFLPIVIGILLVAPFVVQAVPAYLENSSYLTGAAGSSDIGNATLSTRVLPLTIVLPLFGLIPAFAVFSKRFYNRWFTLPAFLLALWVFVSLAFTQGYLVRFPFDYNRFLYFVIMPLLIFLGVLIEYGSDFFARVIDTYRSLTRQTQPTRLTMNKHINRVAKALTRKNLYSIFVLFFLVFSFVALPVFMSPVFNNVGETIQSFYQTMDNYGWEGMQWAKNNTMSNSVFVADALYGWWFGGFAQRPTLAAVDPQYLSLNREVDNATFARNILDTNYIIDNGYMQVREDGGYLARHNPEFLAKIRNEYYPYPFFNFDNDAIEVTLQNGSETEIVYVSDMAVLDMHMEHTANSESIMVTHGNELFNYTQKVTVYAKSVLANVTEILATSNPNVAFIALQFNLYTKSTVAPIISDDKSNIMLIDAGMKTLGQVSFPTEGSRPVYIVPAGSDKSYSPVELEFSLNLASHVEFSFYMGTYQYLDSEFNQINAGTLSFDELVNIYSQQKLSNLQNLPSTGQENFTVFNYQTELQTRQVSYIIVFKNPEQQPRFTNDPRFSLVFINREVAIYMVNGNLNIG